MLDTGRPSQDDNIFHIWHVVFVFGHWLTMALSELRPLLQQLLVLAAETFGVVVTFWVVGRVWGSGEVFSRRSGPDQWSRVFGDRYMYSIDRSHFLVGPSTRLASVKPTTLRSSALNQ